MKPGSILPQEAGSTAQDLNMCIHVLTPTKSRAPTSYNDPTDSASTVTTSTAKWMERLY